MQSVNRQIAQKMLEWNINVENWPRRTRAASQKENAEFSFSVGRPKSVRKPFHFVICGAIQKATQADSFAAGQINNAVLINFFNQYIRPVLCHDFKAVNQILRPHCLPLTFCAYIIPWVRGIVNPPFQSFQKKFPSNPRSNLPVPF